MDLKNMHHPSTQCRY